MANKTSPLQLRFILNPLYWFTWLGIGLLYLISLLPYQWMLYIGSAFGWLTYSLMPQRRRIVRTNIRLVFPELSKQQVRQLVKQNFYSTGIALFESAFSWWASDDKIKPLCHIEGLEHLHEAERPGKGVLLLGGHYTTLEISGRVLAQYADNVYPTYKPAHNPLFEIIMTNSRRRVNKGLVSSRDMRSTLRLLKEKQIIWYASDQDFGSERSVFAPFMGVQTATLDMSARLARRSGSPVVPFYSERLPGKQGYKISFAPMLKGFPSGDEVSDATTMNAAIEYHVRHVPAQYLWAHRRFKTRPHGEPQVYQPKRGRDLRSYTQAHVLLSLPVFFYTGWIAFKNRNLDYFQQRLGFSMPGKADMIIHAASIGEVNAVAPLVELILERNPQLKILLTTNTPSGLATAKHRLQDKVVCHFMPVDWHWLAYHYLNKVAPRCVLIMETEIWPNFYEYCFYKGIANIIINARLSEKSLQVPVFVERWLSQAARYATAILARSTKDAERYARLNVDAKYLKVIGNIKYAVNTGLEPTPLDLNSPYVLFASSRDNEEKQLLQSWLTLDGARPLLVIVPRHIQRLHNILSDLSEFNLSIAVRSRQEPVTAKTQVYIADTFGELNAFIQGSLFVIMGGSLQAFGGQNIIEVARAGKAVLFGPHMENFEAEANEFVEHQAGIQFTDAQQLKNGLQTLLNNPELAEQLGQAGEALLEQHQNVLQDYYDNIKAYCSCLK